MHENPSNIYELCLFVWTPKHYYSPHQFLSILLFVGRHESVERPKPLHARTPVRAIHIIIIRCRPGHRVLDAAEHLAERHGDVTVRLDDLLGMNVDR